MNRLRATLATAAASMLVLTGCGSGTTSGAATSEGATAGAGSAAASTASGPAADGELQTVRVAAVPVVDVAAIYLGEEKGFFAEKGMTIDIQFTTGSSISIPALLQDQYDMVYTGSVNAFQAREKGLPVIAVAEGGRTTGEPGADHGGIVVPEGSEIQDAGDLEGKSVAVNAVKGLHEAAIRQSVKKAGGDPDEVNFLELALPDMQPALERGSVDAISTSEPFLGNAKEAGHRLIADPYIDVDPEFVTAVYLTSEQKWAQDPQFVQDFVEVVKKSQEYATEHPEEFRTELSNFTEIDPETAKTMILTKFGWGFPEQAMQRGAQAAQEAGIVEDAEAGLDGLVVDVLQ
ncbi:ABC transporter substrate-binding protein [Citricoccus sp. NPDC079358]|uniref:NitT/TauT family transport system substrate-binding protein n=1 Tax=Citricoccus muralis TaxID=169134 RepID=A0A3D9LER1_9MICC|nr:ABC transporter substrate-binding protein [Citricoccus muralis]REE04725.1 NitT/TauT family transport system substrate-binding protein [Citricoccus muralis]